MGPMSTPQRSTLSCLCHSRTRLRRRLMVLRDSFEFIFIFFSSGKSSMWHNKRGALVSCYEQRAASFCPRKRVVLVPFLLLSSSFFITAIFFSPPSMPLLTTTTINKNLLL